jgi:hypothetical protein
MDTGEAKVTPITVKANSAELEVDKSVMITAVHCTRRCGKGIRNYLK